MKRVAAISMGMVAAAVCATLHNPAAARGNASVQNLVQSNFVTRQAQLRAQINDAVNAGLLSTTNAAGLLGQLDHINALTQRDVAFGGISNYEANRLNAMFSDVTNEFSAVTPAGINAPARAAYARVYPRDTGLSRAQSERIRRQYARMFAR